MHVIYTSVGIGLGPRTGAENPRTGRWERLRRPPTRLLTSELVFQETCSLSPSPSSPGSSGVLGAEGVGDALVGGVVPPVDAVRVDLEQDGDAVPGAAGDLGGGHTE